MTKQLCPRNAGNFSRPTLVGAAVLAVGLLFVASQASAARVDIIDGQGFEAPYTAGNLEGQLGSLLGDGVQAPWLASSGTTSAAVVQSSVAHGGGGQAVQVDHAANEAAGAGRFGIPVTGWPDNSRYVCIEWDMYVNQTVGAPDTFGPFFGVEAYDDITVGPGDLGLLGSMGVDATTGDVLYQAAGTGVLTETGSVVDFDAWNHFHIDLDFELSQYTVILNGAALATATFVDGASLQDFTDAPIASFAAAGDPASQALVGTAYIDNYEVYQPNIKIPEPTTMVLGLVALVSVSGARSRRR